MGFASLALLTLSLLLQSALREDPKVSTPKLCEYQNSHIQERGMVCGGGGSSLTFRAGVALWTLGLQTLHPVIMIELVSSPWCKFGLVFVFNYTSPRQLLLVVYEDVPTE